MYGEEGLRTADCPIKEAKELIQQAGAPQVQVEHSIQRNSICAIHYIVIFRLESTLSPQPSPAGLSSVLIGEPGAVSGFGRRR